MRIKRGLEKQVGKQLEHFDNVIAYHQKWIKRCEREPDRLSSEAGILVPLSSLKGKHQEALKQWKRDKAKRLRELRKMGFIE